MAMRPTSSRSARSGRRRRAEPRRIAEARRSHLEGDPREHRQRDVALQHEISAGRRLDGRDELRFIVIGVDEQAHRQQQQGAEDEEAGHDGAEDRRRLSIV
jgi:hypothetical protein